MDDFKLPDEVSPEAVRMACDATPVHEPPPPPNAMSAKEFAQAMRHGVLPGDEDRLAETWKWRKHRDDLREVSRCRLGGLLWAADYVDGLPDDHPLAAECGPAIGRALHAFGVREQPQTLSERREYVNAWPNPPSKRGGE